eukprot:TRINITY_DN8577_c0_g1_i3.p1 TRINITY_DN8577_c0_g1~~TRINITY_DN8577_c0_g1_i3.p1  ORF type:complete len:421 (-),score=71.88 TRINITY_DN8577_c0_g1_i3:203-1465(-)
MCIRDRLLTLATEDNDDSVAQRNKDNRDTTPRDLTITKDDNNNDHNGHEMDDDDVDDNLMLDDNRQVQSKPHSHANSVSGRTDPVKPQSFKDSGKLIASTPVALNPLAQSIPFRDLSSASFQNPLAKLNGSVRPSVRPNETPIEETNPELLKQKADDLFAVGHSLIEGFGVPRDPLKGAQFLIQASELGHIVAQCMIGELMESGNILPQNSAKAVEFYTISACLGDYAPAQFKLGVLYQSNTPGIPFDQNKALYFINKAADQGYIDALYFLGNCYSRGHLVIEDQRKAFEFFSRAAGLGDGKSMGRMGIMYQRGIGVMKDVRLAADLFGKAAAKGVPEAHCNLGLMYLMGDGVEKNPQKAVESLLKAAELGDITAQYNLAVCYELGNGVRLDMYKAKDWYMKAAARGDEDARKWLEENGV